MTERKRPTAVETAAVQIINGRRVLSVPCRIRGYTAKQPAASSQQPERNVSGQSRAVQRLGEA